MNNTKHSGQLSDITNKVNIVNLVDQYVKIVKGTAN